ncbi:hypothetical protein [Knoellia subterranea]|uniref:Uncharacterized protein n=1 Tax=Knoellia subterranea KCTC 19937 TaxID=1385521 RepID=A0A0A0JHD9_9MICO|nr:hypothetical protein [Knoellia subterranea]KGN35472.1 hypothetical protein N803_06270 [Knoellia subterranea KCTC 19937]
MGRNLNRAWRERGATGLEWGGIVAVAALVVGLVFVSVDNSGVTQKVSCTVGNIFGGEADCAAAGASTGGGETEAGGDTEGSDNTRRDAEGDTRDSDRNDQRGNRPEPGETAPPGEPSPGGTPGGEPYPEGLGPPANGTTPLENPEPPAWSPPDEGGGQHASEDAGIGDRLTKKAAQLAANALAGKWPDASRNLSHFLGNSGEPLDQDVDSMLESSQNLSSAVETAEGDLGLLAIERAQSSGATGPVTFPINTAWSGVYLNDDQNWYYALNGISWNLTGQVTAYPPTTPGGEWTYKMTTTVNIRDRYNWDGTKSTQIGPFTVTDEQLAELHRKGLAQEYTAVGTSEPRETSG